jgi:hypothetical protein
VSSGAGCTGDFGSENPVSLSIKNMLTPEGGIFDPKHSTLWLKGMCMATSDWVNDR